MSRRAAVWISLGLACAAFAVFSQALYFQFTTDDEFLILRNRWLASAGDLPQLLTGTVLGGAGIPDTRFRPVELLTHAVDVWVWGRDPFGHHLTSVLLHAAGSVLVFCLLAARFALLPSALAALVFALHPLHAMVVPPISGRADPLVLIWICAGLLLFRARPVWSLLCAALAMGSKETGVLFPALLALYDSLDGRPLPWRRHAPCWILGLAFGLWRLAAVHAAGPAAAADPALQDVGVRIFTYLSTLPQGLRVCLWPADVIHVREWPVHTSAAQPMVWGGALLLAGLCAASVAAWRRNLRPLACGLAWFLLSTLPTSNLAAPLYFTYADHWFILPGLGLVLIGAWAAARGWDGPAWQRAAVWAIGIGLAAAGAVITPGRAEQWRDNAAYARRNLARAPDSGWRNYNMAAALVQRGQDEDAAPLFERSIALGLPEIKPRFQLGLLHLRAGRYAEAAAAFERVAALEPRWPGIQELIRRARGAALSPADRQPRMSP